MKAALCNTLRFTVRFVAALVAYFLVFNQFAHAATLPRGLAAAMQTSSGQQAHPIAASSPEANVRDRLQAAHKLYVVNAGTDDHFPLSASAGYDRFVATLQAWGRYTLVNTASEADLVLQFRNAVFTQVQDGTRESPAATVYYQPELRLTIADPQTLQTMWSYVLPASTGTSRKTHQDLFASSVNNVTSQLKLLAGQTLSPAEAAALRPPAARGNHRRLALLLVGGAALLSLPIILFIKSKDDADANQHQFCVAHGLPC